MEKSETYYLAYLDNILGFLQNSQGGKASYAQLYRHCLGVDFKLDKKGTDSLPSGAIKNEQGTHIIDWSASEKYQKNILDSAIEYLVHLKTIDVVDNDVFITFKGHIKITNTFLGDYKKEKSDKELIQKNIRLSTRVLRIERYSIPIAILVSLIAIVISIIAMNKC